MALAADTARLTAKRSHIYPQVVNAAVVYAGGLQAIGNADHGTAANRGRSYPFAIANGAIPVGFAEAGVTGTGSSANKSSILVEGRVQEQRAVTGVTAITDVGKWVYATDDDTLTLTRATLNIPVGIIVDWYSGTSCDVYFLSFGELLAIQAAGGIHRNVLVATMSAGAATGNIATGIVMPCHGVFTNIYGVCVVDATDADVDHSINFEIGGTNVTGGVLNWLFSTALGAKLACTAITPSTAVFHEGDLLDVETVANVAGTTSDPGLLNIYAEYDILPGF